MVARPAAGGGRWVDVDPARLPRWLAGFAERHGAWSATVSGRVVVLTASDGGTAELHAPPGAGDPDSLDDLVAVAQQTRRLGLLLARRASVAVGIADGERLLSSKVDSSYVQARTAAGGWSQHRFARRRENQAKAAASTAADLAARLLLPEVDRLGAVVTGGDRRAVDAVLADPRLAPVAALRSERFLDVPEPRLAVLTEAVKAARSVRIRVRNPDQVG
jgi:Actinobacteria/chloroflexi VLRF1 release factor